MTVYAYYDTEADIAWLPTGHAEQVVCEEVEWGLIERSRARLSARRYRGVDCGAAIGECPGVGLATGVSFAAVLDQVAGLEAAQQT